MTGNSTVSETAEPSAAGEAAADIYTGGRYLENNATWHVEDSPWKATQIARMLDANRLACDTICEVGCGAGEILRQLSFIYPSTTFTGYDISPQAIALCRSRESSRLRFLQLDILSQDVFFDCLLCIDVFEHIEDYMGFVRALKPKAAYKMFHIPLSLSAHSILTPGKLIDEREKWGHLHYFNRESALAALTHCGYDIVDSAYTPHFRDLPSRSLAGAIANVPLRTIFRLAPHLFVRLFGGCSLLVLAR